MFNYTKFIYQRSPETPSQTPRQDVPGSIERQAVSSQELVESRRRDAEKMEKLKKDKDELFECWLNNSGRFNTKEDDVFYRTLGFENKTIGKEAFLLLSLLKKYWGNDKAKELYNGAYRGQNFDLNHLLCFFRTPTKNALKTYSAEQLNGEQAKREIGVYYDGANWYVWNNVKGSKDQLIGAWLHLGLGKLEPALKNPQVEYLVDENRRTEVTSFIKDEIDHVGMSKKDRSAKILEWAETKASNKWDILPEEIHKHMLIIFGERTGYYTYRYNKEKKKIYFLRVKGARLQPGDGDGGYIEVKNSGELGQWHGYTDWQDFLKADVLDGMAPVDIQREIVDYKGATSPESLTEDQKLIRTKGMVAGLTGLPGSFSHKLMDKDYLDVVEEKLVEKLKESSLTETQAKDIAALRKKVLKESIDKYIEEKPETLKKAIEDDPEIKFKIKIDSEDKVEVDFDSGTDKVKYSKLAQDASEAAKETQWDSVIDEKSEEMTKKLGPLAGFLKWFGIDLKKDVAEYYKTGKKSIFLTIIGTVTSVKLGSRLLTSKAISSAEDFKKLAEENSGVIKKNQSFKGDFTLQGYKITIPKGKGIMPGKDFVANGKEIKRKTEEKKEEKPKISFLSLFSSSKADTDEFVMQDEEIIIAQNDIIPGGTIIPKDSKIEKIA